jgi:HK97 family phage major capsid protein
MSAESNKSIKQLDAEAKSLLTSAKAIFEKGEDASPEELATAKDNFKRSQEISDQLAEARKGLDVANRIENTMAALYAEHRPQIGSNPSKPVVDPSSIKGWDGSSSLPPIWQMREPSRLLTGNADFKAWLAKVCPGSLVPETVGMSPAINLNVKDLSRELEGQGVDLKALITYATTSGGANVWSERRPDILGPAPFRPFQVVDLLTRIPVVSNSVDYVRINAFTNAAAPVAAATTTSNGAKPESELTFTQVAATIRVIPHWMPVVNQVLSDAPALRAMIDGFLRDGITEELEDQIVQGDGNSPNFTGIINDANILSQAFSTDLLTTVRKARTAIRTTGKRVVPTAIGMSPATWEVIDLLQDAEQRYYFGGPMAMGTPRLWGLPVIESEAFPDATGVVGDFREGLLFDRESTMIRVSESHSDFFIRNISVILAEGRYGFGLRYPKAFCKFATTS